jgi:hypothetical protein
MMQQQASVAQQVPPPQLAYSMSRPAKKKGSALFVGIPGCCACFVCIWFAIWFLIVANRDNEYWTGCHGVPGVNDAPRGAAVSLALLVACGVLTHVFL